MNKFKVKYIAVNQSGSWKKSRRQYQPYDKRNGVCFQYVHHVKVNGNEVNYIYQKYLQIYGPFYSVITGVLIDEVAPKVRVDGEYAEVNLDGNKFSVDAPMYPQSFYNCVSGQANIYSIDFSKIDFLDCNMVDKMFYNCPKLEYIDLSGFSADSRHMSSMFKLCDSLKEVHVKGCSDTNINLLLYQLNNAKTAGHNDWYLDREWLVYEPHKDDSIKGTGNYYMFRDHGRYPSVNGNWIRPDFDPRGDWEVSYPEQAISLEDLLSGADWVYTVDLSETPLSKNKSTKNAFANCGNLTFVDVSNIDLVGVTVDNMFDRCDKLQLVKVANCSDETIDILFDQLNEHAGKSSAWRKINDDYLSPCVEIYRGTYDGDLPEVGNGSQSAFAFGSDGTYYCMAPEYFTNFESATTGQPSVVSIDEFLQDMTLAKSMRNAFSNNENLVSFSTNGISPDFRPTDFDSMFENDPLLTEIDFSSFSVQDVHNTRNMFRNCTSLESVKFSDRPFFDMDYSERHVSTAESMFEGCTSLKSADLDWLSYAYMTNNMKYMFKNCESLEEVIIHSHFYTDPGTAESAEAWFEGCKSLKEFTIADGDPNTHGIIQMSNVKDLSNMFYGCESFEHFDNVELVCKPTDVTNMFRNCYSLKTVDFNPNEHAFSPLLIYFDTFSIVDAAGMFCRCYNLESIENSAFDTWDFFGHDLRDLSSTFSDCHKLVKGPKRVSYWDNVQSANYAFFNNYALEDWIYGSPELGVNPESLVSIIYMFAGCKNMTAIDIVTADGVTSKSPNVASACGLFDGCESLVSISWDIDTSKVADLNYIFRGCKVLTDISFDLDLSMCVSLKEAFADCESLTEITIRNANNENIRIDKWLHNCKSLEVIHTDNVSQPVIDKILEYLKYDVTAGHSWKVQGKDIVWDKEATYIYCWPKVRAYADGHLLDTEEEGDRIKVPYIESFETVEFKEDNITLYEVDLSQSNFTSKLSITESRLAKLNLNSVNITEDCPIVEHGQVPGRIDAQSASASTRTILLRNIPGIEPMFTGGVYQEYPGVFQESESPNHTIRLNGSSYSSTGHISRQVYYNLPQMMLTSIQGMCQGDANFTYMRLDVSGEITNCSNAFNGCTSLKSVDFYNVALDICTDFSNMFKNCSSLKSITFGTKICEANFSGMFAGCSSLAEVYIPHGEVDIAAMLSAARAGGSSNWYYDYTKGCFVP